jgi:predicted thioesterase
MKLRARQDGVGNLVELRRRHHEDDVLRRFLDGLEQRVERRRRQHVDFVDQEHLVAIAHRGNRQALDDHLAHVVDAGVGGRVDLQHVDVAALGDLDAGVADAARLGGRAVDAVERARQDAGAGGLAAAARAGEHERLGEAPTLEGVLQCPGHGLLAEHVIETLGTPLAGEDLVGHEG